MAGKLDTAVGISQVVIAAVAVVGIGFAICQNRQTVDLINVAADAFRAASTPIVQFEGYQWNTMGRGFVSCDYPPIGFNVYFKHRSGPALVIETSSIEVFTGERKIDAAPEIETGGSGESIVAPGTVSTAVAFASPEFPEIYKRLRGGSPPLLSFILKISYRSVVSSVRYSYEGKIVMLEDCALPNQERWSIGYETFTAK